jgi:Ca2+-binding EF-hand superfamily protein
MQLFQRSSALLAALLVATSDAFSTPSHARTFSGSRTVFASRPSFFSLNSKAEENEDEIERLRSMAAKLRAEAAQLEAEQSQAMADAAERAFRKFDTNQDGQISLDELKAGLEKAFKMELPEKRVSKLMEDFNKTGDGTLKIDEFVNVEQFRNRLDALAREEKAMARKAADEANQEESAVKMIQAQLEMINDKAPSGTDKILSVLPYLFPLLDGLQFARFLVLENPDNVLSAIIGITYGLYRSIPFGGFIAFFALNFLAGNPSINRLVRFNMQQAIFLDIALFFPGLIAALYALIGQAAGFSLPPAVTEIGSDVMFVILLTTIGYATVSSLLGQTPNKIPFISEAVEARMPTVDMFDDQGRFNPRRKKDDDKEEK